MAYTGYRQRRQCTTFGRGAPPAAPPGRICEQQPANAVFAEPHAPQARIRVHPAGSEHEVAAAFHQGHSVSGRTACCKREREPSHPQCQRGECSRQWDQRNTRGPLVRSKLPGARYRLRQQPVRHVREQCANRLSGSTVTKLSAGARIGQLDICHDNTSRRLPGGEPKGSSPGARQARQAHVQSRSSS